MAYSSSREEKPSSKQVDFAPVIENRHPSQFEAQESAEGG